MKQLSFWILLGLVTLLSQGCGVYLAATQPPQVDVGALATGGASRDMVIARVGVPTSSVKHEDGTRTEIDEFYGGSVAGWKFGRAAFHAAADLFTFALWEVVATPTEMAIKGVKRSARAEFDKNDALKEFRVLGADVN